PCFFRPLRVKGLFCALAGRAAFLLRRNPGASEKFHSTYFLFRQQYQAVPGDFKDATRFWGAATLNGNGNRLMDTNDEELRNFQHLSLAGVIEGLYTGALLGGLYAPGQMAPEAPIGGAIYRMNYPCSPTVQWISVRILPFRSRSSSISLDLLYSESLLLDSGVLCSNMVREAHLLI